MNVFEKIIAGACWLYGIAWLIASFTPSALFGEIIAPPPVGIKFIPASLGGAILFGAAPIMRQQERSMGFLFAGGTIALVWPGLWLAAQGQVGGGEGLLWIAIPIVIAAWVVTGTFNRLERPQYASAAFRKGQRDFYNVSLPVQFLLGIVIATITCVVYLWIWRTSP